MGKVIDINYLLEVAIDHEIVKNEKDASFKMEIRHFIEP